MLGRDSIEALDQLRVLIPLVVVLHNCFVIDFVDGELLSSVLGALQDILQRHQFIRLCFAVTLIDIHEGFLTIERGEVSFLEDGLLGVLGLYLIISIRDLLEDLDGFLV